MSKALDTLLDQAKEKGITDKQRIAKILESLLETPCSVFDQASPHRKSLLTNIAKGFFLPAKALEACSIKELLTIISYSEGINYFAVWEEDLHYYDERIRTGLSTWYSCYLLARMIYNAKAEGNTTLSQFLCVDYLSFSRLLEERMMTMARRHDRLYDAFLMRRALKEACYSAAGLVFGSSWSADHIDPFTIEDLFTAAFRHSDIPWACAFVPIEDFVKQVQKGYSVLNTLFMKCIWGILTDTDVKQDKALFERCYGDSVVGYPFFTTLQRKHCYKHFLEA